MKLKQLQNILSVPIQSVTARDRSTKLVETTVSEGEDGEDFQQVKVVKKEKISKTKEVVFLD
ncbi:MAG: hypothetical protein MZV64_04415 [Ignavibacteriales bacterium]|nr:hypothetical protein [Ignavibacteriales bacterium]